MFAQDVLKDAKAAPAVTAAQKPVLNQFLQRMFGRAEMGDPKKILDVRGLEILNESGLTPIKVCFLQVLKPSDYDRERRRDPPREPAPADMYREQSKLSFIRFGFHDSGYDPTDIVTGLTLILTAGSYIDPFPGRIKLYTTPSNPILDTTTYQIDDRNLVYNIGLRSAIERIGVDTAAIDGPDGILTISITSPAGYDPAGGQHVQTLQRNHRHSAPAPPDICAGNATKNAAINSWPAGTPIDVNLQDIIIDKLLGDYLQVLAAKCCVGTPATNGNTTSQYCMFTVDSVVKSRCIEYGLPVCVQEGDTEYADLGRVEFYGGDIDPERIVQYAYESKRAEILANNRQVIRELNSLRSYVTSDADPTVVELGNQEKTIYATYIPQTQTAVDVRSQLNTLIDSLLAAVTAVAIPEYAPGTTTDDIYALDMYRANLMNDGYTILKNHSLFSAGPIDRDPLNGVDIFATINSWQTPSRRSLARRNQGGGSWGPKEVTPYRNFNREYYGKIISLMGVIFRALPADLTTQLQLYYNHIDPVVPAELSEDAAYHFIIHTAPYFNHIGYSCLHDDTLVFFISSFFGLFLAQPKRNMPLAEFKGLFESQPIYLRMMEEEAQLQAEYAQFRQENTGYKQTLNTLAIALKQLKSQIPAHRQTGKYRNSRIGILESQLKRNTQRSKQRHARMVGRRGVSDTFGGARRYRDRSKGATVKRIRAPRLKTRKMRRRAVTHIRE